MSCCHMLFGFVQTSSWYNPDEAVYELETDNALNAVVVAAESEVEGQFKWEVEWGAKVEA